MTSSTVPALSRFVYRTTRPSLRTSGPGPSRPAALPRTDPPDHLPDSQLTQLSKCIGCGLGWTSRKTARQKRTHITQCAKKNALTKDTIRILIQKEIAPPQNTASSPNEATLMDSVVPAKKRKRQQALPTVRSLPETRDSILDRARDILGPADGRPDPQSAQQVAQNALARRNTKGLASLASAEEPPFTQAFGASTLHRVATTSLFAQDSVLSSDRHKRPASPPPLLDSNSKTVRRRLLQ